MHHLLRPSDRVRYTSEFKADHRNLSAHWDFSSLPALPSAIVRKESGCVRFPLHVTCCRMKARSNSQQCSKPPAGMRSPSELQRRQLRDPYCRFHPYSTSFNKSCHECMPQYSVPTDERKCPQITKRTLSGSTERKPGNTPTVSGSAAAKRPWQPLARIVAEIERKK